MLSVWFRFWNTARVEKLKQTSRAWCHSTSPHSDWRQVWWPRTLNGRFQISFQPHALHSCPEGCVQVDATCWNVQCGWRAFSTSCEEVTYQRNGTSSTLARYRSVLAPFICNLVTKEESNRRIRCKTQRCLDDEGVSRSNGRQLGLFVISHEHQGIRCFHSQVLNGREPFFFRSFISSSRRSFLNMTFISRPEWLYVKDLITWGRSNSIIFHTMYAVFAFRNGRPHSSTNERV